MIPSKPFFTLIAIIAILFLTAFIVQCVSYSKDDVIIKQNDKEIIVKKYETHVSTNESFKGFYVKIDSSYWKYKQNEILYDGILIKAEHDPDRVYLRVTKNKKTHKLSITEDVSEYFSCRQVQNFEDKIGKRMVITKTYYPRERIFYKFP